jgi:serine/threonine protein kinase
MNDDDRLPDPLPPGFRLGRYVIESELGSNAFGRVYKASDPSLTGVVAVNVLAARLRNEEGIHGFVRAVRVATLSASGPVYDYSEYYGIPFVVVGYVEGVGAVDVSKA